MLRENLLSQESGDSSQYPHGPSHVSSPRRARIIGFRLLQRVGDAEVSALYMQPRQGLAGVGPPPDDIRCLHCMRLLGFFVSDYQRQHHYHQT
jgi:hypothetical protein